MFRLQTSFQRLMGLISILLCAWVSASAQTIEYLSSALWNSTYDFKISGNYGYAAFQNGLMVLDISSLDSMHEVSKLYLQGQGRDIEVNGNYLYLADGFAGIQIIDISNPFNPALAASYPIGMVNDIFIRGNLAFVAAGQLGVLIYNITNPVDLIEVSIYDTTGITGSCSSVFVMDSLLFAPFGRILHIVSIADSANPLHIGSYQGAFGINNVFARDQWCYLADGPSYTILDIADPADPIVISGRIINNSVNEVVAAGHYLYISNGENGMAIENIQFPSQPEPASQLELNGVTTGLNLVGSLAFLSQYPPYSRVPQGPWGIMAVNVSNPTNPVVQGVYGTSAYNKGIFIQGRYAYLAGGISGMYIIDIADPSSLRVMSLIDTGHETRSIVVRDTLAYVADYGAGMKIIGVSDPSAPYQVGQFTAQSHLSDIAISGNYAYLATHILDIVDISDQANPVLLGHFTRGPFGGHCWSVVVRDTLAFAVTSFEDPYYDELEIIDISDPAAPVLVASTDPYWSSSFSDICLNGDYAFVADYPNGLRIFDISDPASPELVTTYTGYGGLSTVSISGIYAYVGQDEVGILDISNPAIPVPVDNYDTPGNPMGIALSGGHIFVADATSVIVLRNPMVSANDDGPRMPAVAALMSAYPNPFNASITISYSLPAPGPVSLDIYDILGRKVATLFEGVMPAGESRAFWNAKEMPSGLYFARLIVGERQETVRMVLLK
ncbi:MAG: hypothetical protein A2W25_01230 [candidate division Zixibacteria bacterium RBG_16_53_22]|nr:MAG: hypothetical protein A2W25_01230 [candidate division Zixibacteria bacterium RBG_16_53_22]